MGYPLENNFTHHPPKGNDQEVYEALRERGKQFAALMLHHCKPSRELSLALTKLEEAVMWANAAGARN
ncbi:MAG: hypothetical protein KAT00_13370 [Planctomycetes bacterium]|nr:hypothetical protein [Planctomycetota bacterium]